MCGADHIVHADPIGHLNRRNVVRICQRGPDADRAAKLTIGVIRHEGPAAAGCELSWDIQNHTSRGVTLLKGRQIRKRNDRGTGLALAICEIDATIYEGVVIVQTADHGKYLAGLHIHDNYCRVGHMGINARCVALNWL